MLRSVIVGAVVSLSLIGFTLAVPQCSGDCANGYCPTTCYTNEANLLCTCETKYGTDEVVCKKPDGEECDGNSLPSKSPFTEEECKLASTDIANSNAYIYDTNIAGPRCRIITDCQTMEEAAVSVPCTDCISGRSCSSCPQLTYNAGTTSVHWICQSAVGDPYTHQMVEGTSCSVTHECEQVTVKTILCASGDGEAGVWKDTTTDPVGVDVNPEDVSCNCDVLRIPVAEDTNVFCDPSVDPTDGNYILDKNQKCDVVCDGSVFIPLSCKFDTGNQVAWHISYGGEDIALDDETTCFACSINTCDNGSTNEPGTTEAQETTASEAPETTASEAPETTTTKEPDTTVTTEEPF